MAMDSTEVKTIIQCDFDNTIAEDDVSFLLLNAFADGSWRQLLRQYREDKIPVGVFNAKSFAMVRADKQSMLDFILVKNKIRIRPGFKELLTYCAKRGFKFVIVSNGLSFYIEGILRDIGVNNIDVFASQAQFNPEGVEVTYMGPDGRQLERGFKEAYTELFLSQGYRVVYIGDGKSDRFPASLANYIFARDDLLAYCREKNLDCTPFDDLNDVVRGLELLAPK